MSLSPTQPLCTAEEYLALERASEERHEYLDGRLYTMPFNSVGRRARHGQKTPKYAADLCRVHACH